MIELTEKTLSSKDVYKGIVIDVKLDEVELSDGKISKREVAQHSGGVVIAAKTINDEILLVKQYRYPIGKPLIEVPAGKLERGENVLEAAKRELLEETGYVAKNWVDLGYIYSSPGFCDEKLYLFMATELDFVAPNPDDGEILQPLQININEVFKMIKNGQIDDAKTIAVLMKAFKL